METGFSLWHILLFLSPQIHCLGMNIIVNINCTWSSSEFCNFERCSCLMSAVWLVSISNNRVGMGALLALFWVLNGYINLSRRWLPLGYCLAVVFAAHSFHMCCCPSLHVILSKKPSSFLPSNFILPFIPH